MDDFSWAVACSRPVVAKVVKFLNVGMVHCCGVGSLHDGAGVSYEAVCVVVGCCVVGDLRECLLQQIFCLGAVIAGELQCVCIECIAQVVIVCTVWGCVHYISALGLYVSKDTK